MTLPIYVMAFVIPYVKIIMPIIHSLDLLNSQRDMQTKKPEINRKSARKWTHERLSYTTLKCKPRL